MHVYHFRRNLKPAIGFRFAARTTNGLKTPKSLRILCVYTLCLPTAERVGMYQVQTAEPADGLVALDNEYADPVR